MSTTTWVRAAAAARVAWGVALVAAPHRIPRYGAAPAVAVLRVLGARQIVQGAVTLARPTPLVTGCGALVDALHAGTDLAAAAGSARWRPVALPDAVVALGFAAAGWWLRDAA
ncbi:MULTISPECIES: hypothetical protein [unclassified Actinoplanes]|uniref:hypothetical protein n=1 Tax=unclassified Actinoplanes TaxID=2626549 RepID=UPI0012BA65B2|nr:MULTISPECIES: hypothetical protein [unclassified Actinoplanes]